MIRLALRLCVALTLALAASLPARAIDIREVTSPGGIRAWLVEEHSIPFTALEIRFRGGTSLDPADKRGVTLLMASLLEEGAGDFDSQGFARARDDLAAEFRFDAGRDSVSVSARMLSENRDQAADLLRLALTQPRFDPDAIERVRGQMLSIIRSEQSDPNAIAWREFDALAFGDHPYGSSPNGTEDSVASITRDDLVAIHRGALARDRLYVSAVGDITAEDLGPLLDRILGDLPETGAPLPPHVEPALTGGVSVIDFPVPQSVVVFGQRGIRRDDPDFFAAYVLNHILGGGGFGSRLMDELRERRGLTYGINTWLAPMDLAELWQGQFASANERVAEAVRVVRDQWARIAAEGVSETELQAAKTYLTGSYPLRFDGNGPIAAILVGMQMEGLPISYVNERNGYVEAVTAEDIRRVAARLIQPDGLRFVVVGQPRGLDVSN